MGDLRTVTMFALIALLVQGNPAGEEADSSIESVSSFLLELIDKYDRSGKGAIAIEQYPTFLTEVLVKGHQSTNPGDEVDQATRDLLLEATTGFAKKYNTTEVGVQDFYFDLIKEFTTFLLENEEEYTPIIETFFGDTPFSDEPNPGFGEEYESEGEGAEERQEL